MKGLGGKCSQVWLRFSVSVRKKRKLSDLFKKQGFRRNRKDSEVNLSASYLTMSEEFSNITH